MGESADHKKARQLELQNAKLQQDIEKENLARQKDIYGQVSPFGRGLVNAGTAAMHGVAPDYFRLGTRNALAGAFGQERQNLADFLGRSGQGFGGLAAGPAAHLGSEEARAVGDAENQAILNALSMGFQGSNVLQGQQSIFDPRAFGGMAGSGFQSYTQATPMMSGGAALGQSLLGAALNAGTSYATGGLSSFFKPPAKTTPALYGGS